MKRLFSAVIIALLYFCSCEKEESVRIDSGPESIITASVDGAFTKVYTDGLKCVWDSKDSVTVFSTNRKSLYRYTGISGQSEGDFTLLSSAPVDMPSISRDYAFYPAIDGMSVISDGIIRYPFAEKQNFRDSSFAKGSCVLAASSEIGSNIFSFRSVCGFIVVKIYGSARLRTVSIEGNDGEILSGNAKIAFPSPDFIPLCTMEDGGGKILQLDCGEQGIPISPDSDSPTCLWLSIPPTTFANGFSVSIEDVSGNICIKKIKKQVSVFSGHVLPISPFELLGGDSTVLDSGTCGPNLTWRLFDNGLLKITGTGRSYDYVKGLLDGMTREQIENYTGPSYYGFQSGKTYDHEHGVYAAPWYKYRPEVDFTNYTTKAAYDKHNPNGWQYKAISIDPGITYIGDWMFYRCCAKEITIPEGVTEIADWGIRYSPTLLSITIPSTVTKLGDNGISRNEVAETISLGNGLEEIGYNALGQNSKVKSITLPPSCVSTGNTPFMGNSEMEYVDLGGLERIPDRCCVSNVCLKTAIIPNTATRIEEAAFYNCDLRSVTIPESIDTIYNSAFYSCDSLESVYVRSQKIANRIGGSSASNGWLTQYCKHLYIYSPISCGYAESTMHYDGMEGDYKKYTKWEYVHDDSIIKAGTICSGVYYIIYKTEVDGEYKLVIDSNGSGSIQSSLRPWNVYSDNIVELRIGSGVSIPSAYYFANELPSLRKADIACTVISDRFMYNAPNLTELTLHEGLLDIPAYAFYGSKVSYLIIPDSVEEVGMSAFSNSGANSQVVEIGSGLKRVGTNAFRYFSKVIIPSNNSLVVIGDYAFTGSVNTGALELPEVTTIGALSFYSSSGYSSITIGDAIESIGNSAFYYNTNDVYIGKAESEVTVGSNAFCKTPAAKMHWQQ